MTLWPPAPTPTPDTKTPATGAKENDMKHAASSDWTAVEKRAPKHSVGWTRDGRYEDACHLHTASIPGKHAKPFAKHHPATPVTYDGTGTTTPLVAAAPALDVVA